MLGLLKRLGRLLLIAVVIIVCAGIVTLGALFWQGNTSDSVKVKGHIRKDGTYVAPHERKKPQQK